jgi:hypothetical protein
MTYIFIVHVQLSVRCAFSARPPHTPRTPVECTRRHSTCIYHWSVFYSSRTLHCSVRHSAACSVSRPCTPDAHACVSRHARRQSVHRDASSTSRWNSCQEWVAPRPLLPQSDSLTVVTNVLSVKRAQNIEYSIPLQQAQFV